MARKRKGRPVNGWLVLDKPEGLTSTAAVGRVKWLYDAAKAGHAGTLDPIATGVLPIGLGEATKLMPYVVDATKVYRFTLRWGEARDTEDREGQITATSPVRPDAAAITAALPRFLGEIEQVPPAFSAIKVQGERAYDLAREGVVVELAARRVQIHALRLLGQPDPDHAEFEAQCGKGTYMRALARDLALALGTVGHLAALRRLRVGPFTLDDAVTLAHLEALVGESDADSVLLPVGSPLDDIPAVTLTQPEARRIRSGQPVALLRRSDRERLIALFPGEDAAEGAMVLAVLEGAPVAVARIEGAELHPVRLLNL